MTTLGTVKVVAFTAEMKTASSRSVCPQVPPAPPQQELQLLPIIPFGEDFGARRATRQGARRRRAARRRLAALRRDARSWLGYAPSAHTRGRVEKEGRWRRWVRGALSREQA